MERASTGTSSAPVSDDEDSKEQELEEWSEWLKRTAHKAEDECRKLGLDDWVTLQRKRKWRLAGHTARREDERWSTAMLNWHPAGKRFQGHPNKRWADDLNKFFKMEFEGPVGFWRIIAQNRDEWQSLENDFINFSN